MFGVVVGLLLSLTTYFLVVRPLQQSRRIREEEKEIFILTATLLWGIMIQEAVAWLYTNNAKTVLADRRRRGEDRRRAHAGQRNLHRHRLLAGDRRALAHRQPDARRQGGARRFDEPARRDAARRRTVARLYRRLGDLRRAGGNCRRAARHVPRRLLVQRRSVDRERLLDRGAGRPRQRVRLADRRLCRGLSRDPHRLSRVAGLSHHPGVAAAGRRDVCAPARPAGRR